jgi:hypothetical protein
MWTKATRYLSLARLAVERPTRPAPYLEPVLFTEFLFSIFQRLNYRLADTIVVHTEDLIRGA